MGALAKHKGKQESYFDINLAPMLDVIVAIIPMLLMSVVFIQINMIETQIPQIVADAIEKDNKNENRVSIALKVTSKNWTFEVTDKGKKDSIVIPVIGSKSDYDELYKKTIELKRKYPETFKVDLKPSKEVTLDKLVQVMDKIRAAKTGEGNFPVRDEKTGATAQTDLMFPEIVFAQVYDGA